MFWLRVFFELEISFEYVEGSGGSRVLESSVKSLLLFGEIIVSDKSFLAYARILSVGLSLRIRAYVL